MSDDEGYAPAAQMLICFIFPASVQENTDSDDRSQIAYRATGKCAVFSPSIELASACEVLERLGATYGPPYKAQCRFWGFVGRRTSSSTHIRSEGCIRFRVDPGSFSARVYAY